MIWIFPPEGALYKRLGLGGLVGPSLAPWSRPWASTRQLRVAIMWARRKSVLYSSSPPFSKASCVDMCNLKKPSLHSRNDLSSFSTIGFIVLLGEFSKAILLKPKL